MLKTESIFLNTKKKGVLISFFTTYSGQTADDGRVTYLLCDSNNKPIKIIESPLDSKYVKNSNGAYEPTANYIVHTGTTIIQTAEVLSSNVKQKISSDYFNKISTSFNANSNTNFLPSPMSFVQFEDINKDDMYINILLNREIDVLDTLNIYNVSINDTPTQECKTGVLYGKLIATQNLNDENGEKLKLPLRNTVVGIFNKSEAFPDVTSTDENGNRLTLNIKENINTDAYFNKESVLTDLKYLTDTSSFTNIPEQYKYTTITNEEGEFILYDVPIGEQSFVFEVDLLKLGLTADEVALNFFEYPLEESPIIDKVPHFVYRQIPVNILPSWGVNQSGYTELNISIALDLRKWTTYIISPISYKNKTIEEMFLAGTTTKLTCAIRDMTKKMELNRPNVELVEVPDIFNRNTEQITGWNGEVKQLDNKVEFTKTGFNIFKLPANIYDANGIDSNGKKGVWLAAYQFKMYYSDEVNIYRATGYEREFLPDKVLGRTHFNLNRNAEYGNSDIIQPIGKIGQYPYEKPWTATYPQQYHIPKPPTIFNEKKFLDPDILDYTEPLFLDGDRAGYVSTINSPSEEHTGYGLQEIGGSWNANMFAREVTRFSVYKYESGVTWHEQYTNGYNPNYPNEYSQYGTISGVLNGEQFQRLECGYAYWLKPEGWPRIVNAPWGDSIIPSDIFANTQYGPFPPQKFSPPSYVNHIYKYREDTLLKLDNEQGFLKTGALDIYRVMNPEKVFKPLPPPLDKFVKIHIQNLLFADSALEKLESGKPIIIKNLGTTKVDVFVTGDIVTLEPGEQFHFGDELFADTVLTLPANNRFDAETNSYTTAKYELTLWSFVTPGGFIAYGGKIFLDGDDINKYGLPAGAEDNIPNYYVVQIIPHPVLMTFPYLSMAGYTNEKIAVNGFTYSAWYGVVNAWPYASPLWVTTYTPQINGQYVNKPTPNPYTLLLNQPGISITDASITGYELVLI